MEGGNKEGRPQLLDLIHKDGEWVMRAGENEGSFGVEDEKKLELRLGPPGEDWSVNEEKMTLDFSRPLGCSKSNTWVGSSSQKPIFSSPWNTNPSAYLQFLSVKAIKTCCTKGVGELQGEKKASSLPCATTAAPANTAVNNSSQKRSAPAPVVGWPPVRSFRKNLANSSSTKQAVDNTKESCCNKGMFVKINMDGVAIGRKVDIKAYDSYESLSSAVDDLFRGLLAAQRDSPVTGNPNNEVEDVKEITGLLDGSGEYTLVYEDNEGDRMLAGDVPWNIFASTVKRLRVLKSCELSSLSVGNGGIGKQGKKTSVTLQPSEEKYMI